MLFIFSKIDSKAIFESIFANICGCFNTKLMIVLSEISGGGGGGGGLGISPLSLALYETLHTKT